MHFYLFLCTCHSLVALNLRGISDLLIGSDVTIEGKSSGGNMLG